MGSEKSSFFCRFILFVGFPEYNKSQLVHCCSTEKNGATNPTFIQSFEYILPGAFSDLNVNFPGS